MISLIDSQHKGKNMIYMNDAKTKHTLLHGYSFFGDLPKYSSSLIFGFALKKD
jgi:hypothetical protein